MPGTVVGQSMNLGYAGKISRNPMNKVHSRFVKSILDGNGDETLSAIPFGYAVVVNTDNTVSKFGQSGSGVSAATAALFSGIAVAEVKQSMVLSFGVNSGEALYAPAQPCDVLQQGSATVYCKEGTPTAGGKVYIGTVAGAHTAVGEFCATDSPETGTAVELPNCKWTTGRQDASGITEMTINYPVQA